MNDARNPRRRNSRVKPTRGEQPKPTLRSIADSDWRVVDDLPDFVPVGAAELDVLETFLGKALTQLLGGNDAKE